MKNLLIMRHAKSSWKDQALPDHDRPLNNRGREDAPRMGRLLRKKDLAPDVILASSAQRARETADAVAQESGAEGAVVLLESLYAAPPEAYLEALSGVSDKARTALVIGHNPGLEALLEELTGEAEPMPTAAVAHLVLPIRRWAELKTGVEAELRTIWRPREVE